MNCVDQFANAAGGLGIVIEGSTGVVTRRMFGSPVECGGFLSALGNNWRGAVAVMAVAPFADERSAFLPAPRKLR